MSLETLRARYPVYSRGHFEKLSLREVVHLKKEVEPSSFVWSARLSTGIFGKLDCPSGNKTYVPKGANEVILGVGDEGLAALIDLGFIPCPKCHPENVEGFWEKATPAINKKYPHLRRPEDFVDKKIVGYDARNISWKRILPYLSMMPNRVYLPPNLSEEELQEFKGKINKMGFSLPSVGYYTDTFIEYKIK